MKHPNPLAWFRFHAGDLPLFAWLSFRLHAVRCTTCGARLRVEQAQRASIEAALDAKRPVARRTPRAWIAIPVLATAVAIVVVFLRSPSADEPSLVGEDDGMRAKGGSSFLVYVGAGDAGAEPLGEKCRPGDALQAQYRSEKAYLLVVGVDPENQARTLVPLDGTTSMPIRPGVQSVPQSWVLDAVRGRERFVAFFSDAPLDSRSAQAAAREDRPRLDGAIVVVRECSKVLP